MDEETGIESVNAVDEVLGAVMAAALLIVVAAAIRARVEWFRALFLPASLIAGVLALVLGPSIAWGQYVVGIGLGLLVLSPVFGLDPMAGALIEIGFEGGHGTAAGLAGTFEEFGFAEGADMALALATIGLVSGVVLGTVLVNWAVGWLLLRGLQWIERATWGGDGGVELLVHVPLLPLAMIGGVLLQLLLDRIPRERRVDRHLVNRISGTALDLIIVAAIGTLSLEAIGGNAGALAVLAVGGIAWNVGAFLLLAPRIVPAHPYERGLGDFGQSMGMTVTGLLLMRIADPSNRSGGVEAFGYKQLLFEPVVGGGLFTAASIPLIVQFGPVPVLVLTSVLLVFWILFGMWRFGPSCVDPDGRSRS